MMILVECFNDIQLMFRLGYIPDEIDHAGNKFAVYDGLEYWGRRRLTSIGVVDEDSPEKQKKWLEEYPYKILAGAKKESKSRKTIKKSITLMERQNSKYQFLIEVSPNLETWIYEIANRKKIIPSKYGLPNIPSEAHKRRSEDTIQDGFRKLYIDICKKKDWEIELMKKWINEAISKI